MNFDNREQIVKSVQKSLGLLPDGVDGSVTWNKIQDFIKKHQLEIIEEPVVNGVELSAKSMKLILDYEVGGGENYYNKFLKKPCWPQGASGVTIGIGYDLGYNSNFEFEQDWGKRLSVSDMNLLRKILGYKGLSAKSKLNLVRHIEIPWEDALQVFKQRTIPRFVKTTLNTFPKADELHPDAFGALVSLVFNRGGSLKGDSRQEMARIRELVAEKNYKEIARQIRLMKRLWQNRGLDGLLRRRDEEAALIESCE